MTDAAGSSRSSAIQPCPLSCPPSSTLTQALPDRIGQYPVRAKLGEGATSEVFLARDVFREREVAIKRVRTGFAADSRDGHFQARFFAAEAALVGRLQHPNVVQIFDAVADAEAPYLVMEYVRGQTLRRFCRADALLPLEQIAQIGFKCAMALGYVFRQGLIHRDVKPANILAVTDGEPSPTSRSPTSAASLRSTPTAPRSTASARWPICRRSSSTATTSTAGPTCTRCRRCSTT
jgi:serine/threonine protein kinase